MAQPKHQGRDACARFLAQLPIEINETADGDYVIETVTTRVRRERKSK
jgi:hypothetical protein